ncbi:MAG: proprotein convertase P-domain-containing protein [Saprospiraceae bacterium]
MRKPVYLFLALLFISTIVQGQRYSLDNTDLTVCSGDLLDPGGALNYGNNERYTSTICPTTVNSQIALNFQWSDIRSNDLFCIYDGENTSAPELTCSSRWTGARLLVQATAENMSGCLTLSWQSNGNDVGKGFEAEIECRPICQPVVPTLATSNPAVREGTIADIDLCPGDLLVLRADAAFPQNDIAYNQRVGLTSFRWNLPDGRQQSGRDLLYAFTEPGGYLIELTAIDHQGCQSMVPLAVRARVASPPTIMIGDALTDTICAPEVLSQDLLQQNTVGTTTPTQYYSPLTSRTDSLPLPDGTGASHESTIVISQFAEGAVLTDVSQLVEVCAIMEHSWLRDLSIELVAPDGKVAILHDHPGRFGTEAFLGEPIDRDANATTPLPGVGYSYCWNDDDPKGDWLTYLRDNPNTLTLPAGMYRSYDPLSVFVGSPLNGAWTMRIKDHWEADNGWIFEWSIRFADNLPLAIDSFQTQIIDIRWLKDRAQSAYSPTSIAYAPTVPGTVRPSVRITNDFGCTYDTNFTVVVLPETSPECGPCIPTTDTLPMQIVDLGDTVRFDLTTAGAGGTMYRFAGSTPFTFGTNPPNSPLVLPLAVSSPPVTQLDNTASELLSVCVDIENSDARDLSLTLVSPNGQELILAQNDAAGRTGFVNTCFSESGTVSVQDPNTTSEELRPRGDWSVLANAQVEGTWELRVSDAQGFVDTSLFHQWSLNFEGGASGSISAPATVFNISDKIFGDLPENHRIYTFSYTDASGCERTLIYPVRVRKPCKLSLKQLGFNPPSCEQRDDGEIVVTALDNQGVVTYSLNGETNTTGKFEDLFPGEYIITAVDSASCPAELPVRLDAPAGLDLEIALDFISCEPVYYGIAIRQNDTLGIREMNWLDDPTASTVYRDSLRPGIYNLRTVDANGCPVIHPVTIPDFGPIGVTATATSPDCSDNGNGKLALTISGGEAPYDVYWDDIYDGAERDFLFAGDYTGIVTDARGCEELFSFNLSEPPPLDATVEIEANWCAGESDGAIALTVTGGSSQYQSRLANGVWEEGTLIYGVPGGSHTVEVRDANACLWTTNVFVPTLSGLEDPFDLALFLDKINYGDTIALDASAGKDGAISRVFWSYTADGNFACDTCIFTDFLPLSSGNLMVMVEDTFGCRLEASAQLLVTERPSVFVPTGFAPDGDVADNTRLRVHGRSGTLIERFIVFDRWGTPVYETENLLVNSPHGWDGQYRGKPAQAGNYLYEVIVRDPTGAVRRFSGNTTLIR